MQLDDKRGDIQERERGREKESKREGGRVAGREGRKDKEGR